MPVRYARRANLSERSFDMGNYRILSVSIALVMTLFSSRAVEARTKLEHICSIYGQKEMGLVAIGLVTGLNGTGDGGKHLPAIRALGAAMNRLHNPTTTAELKDAKNSAIVMIHAKIPKSGIRRGQKVDCVVTSMLGAKSLTGGYLLVTPVENEDRSDTTVMGMASGKLIVTNINTPTTAEIPGGIVLSEDIVLNYIQVLRDGRRIVTLLLNERHANFQSAAQAAFAINGEFEYESGKSKLARPTGEGTIEVELPSTYYDSPIDFIALVLSVSIESPHSQAKVLINRNTGVVIITGEVEVAPTVISHKDLVIKVGGAAAPGAGGDNRFVPFAHKPPQKLEDLVQALNQLQVPTESVMDILKELHRSGKLHAVFEERI